MPDETSVEITVALADFVTLDRQYWPEPADHDVRWERPAAGEAAPEASPRSGWFDNSSLKGQRDYQDSH